MAGETILVVDDEANIVDLVRLYLEQAGYRVEAAHDGLAAIELIRSLQPALVVLDIMLPELDGFEVCRQVRLESDVPIIMLTARDDDIDKIVGLELGADDYLTKPFNPRELTARAKAILRRSDGRPKARSEALHAGDLSIDPARREVVVAGQPVELRAKEFDLYGQTRTVDVHIAHLRKRIAASSSIRIETVTGVGYKLVDSAI